MKYEKYQPKYDENGIPAYYDCVVWSVSPGDVQYIADELEFDLTPEAAAEVLEAARTEITEAMREAGEAALRRHLHDHF